MTTNALHGTSHTPTFTDSPRRESMGTGAIQQNLLGRSAKSHPTSALHSAGCRHFSMLQSLLRSWQASTPPGDERTPLPAKRHPRGGSRTVIRLVAAFAIPTNPGRAHAQPGLSNPPL